MQDNPIAIFSPRLRAFMGEWATYYVVKNYHQNFADERIPDVQFFETGEFLIGPSSAFDNSYHLFETLGIIKQTDEINTCKSTCAYENVWKTIFENPKDEIVELFFRTATDWADSAFTKSEHESFTIDENCRPLFAGFEKAGLVASMGEHFFWTHKIRPFFEAYGYWRPQHEVEFHSERKVISELTGAEISQIDKLAALNDQSSTIAFIKGLLKSNTENGWEFAKRISEIMYPNKWGSTYQPSHWKWYGDISSQGSPQFEQ